MHDKLIEIITTSTFYLKFKENKENDMTFCYFSCLSRYCLQHLSMAALRLLTLDSLPQSDQTVSQLIADTNSLKNIAKAGLYT